MVRNLLIILSLILILTIFFFFIIPKDTKKAKLSEQESVSEPIKLFLSADDKIITKEAYLIRQTSELKKIEKALEVFISELSPPLNTTRVLGVYRDKENKIYIDLSANLSIPTEAKTEFELLKSLYLTLKTNFNWITDVKILISGEEKETLSGHVLIDSLRDSLEDN